MKFCKEHWQLCRDAVDERGMSPLVAADGEEAMERTVEELQGGKAKFDPLMSLHWHWTNSALRNGGLYLMGQNETGENEGHYCPVCEFAKHMAGFDAKSAIGGIADQMAEHCRAEGLIPRAS
jgi:hypothetical protein